MGCASAWAQAAGQPPGAEPSLAQMVDAQQAALGSGDAEQVFATSRDLGAFSLRLLAATELGRGDAGAAAGHDLQSLGIVDSSATRLELAAALLANQRLVEAEVEIDRVIAAEPNNAPAWRLRGQARLLGGDPAGAIEAMERSDTLAPELSTELLLLQTRLAQPQPAGVQPAGVQALIERIVARQGDDARLRLALAGTLEQAGDLPGAIREANRAVTLDPASPTAQLALGSAYWELNQYQYNEPSLEHFRAAQALDPAGYLSNFNLGTVESQYQNFEPAARHLQAAAAADPRSPDPYLQLGMNAYEQGDGEAARGWLERYAAGAETLPSRNDAQLRRALLVLNRVAAEEGRGADAAKLAERAEAIKMRLLREAVPAASNQSIGMVAINPPVSTARKPATAATSPGETLAPSPAAEGRDRELKAIVAKSLNDMGTVLARKRDYAGAIVPFRYAAAADPKLDPVMRNLGLAAFHTETYDESGKALAVWIAGHPEDMLARADLGISLFHLHRFAEAAETFRAAEPTMGVNPAVAPTFALAEVRSGGGAARARAILDRLMAASPTPEAQVGAAAAFLELPDLGRAEALARDATAADPAGRRGHVVLGRVLLAQGSAAPAASEFRQALAVDGSGDGVDGGAEIPETRLLLARALLAAGSRGEAAALVDDLRKHDPGLAGELKRRGEALLAAGATRAALDELESAAALDPAGVREEIARARRMLAAK